MTLGGSSESPASNRQRQPSGIATVRRVSPLFVGLAIVLACADNFADPDLWRHVLIGRTILATGHIPAHDAWSYTVAGFPLRNHEWLAEAMLAFAYGWFGILGLKLVKILCASVVVLALTAGLAQTAASVRIQRPLLILTAAALTTQMQFRPQLFTFAMLSIVMAVLATEVYAGRAHLWPLIPMFALWANLHGGFTTGLGALGIASVVVVIQDLLIGTAPRRGLRLAGVTVLAALATLLNPLGIEIWGNVMNSVSDPLLRLIVNDWVSLPRMMLHLWKTGGMGLLQVAIALMLFAAFFVSLAMAPKLDDAALAAIAVVFVGAAFFAMRNVALGVIAVAIPLAHHLALALPRPAETAERDLSPALVVAIIAIVALAGGVFSPRLPTWEPMPAGAVAFLEARGPRGNILNQFEWGDYLIWHLPHSRVFIDARAELVYPDSVMREYAEFYYDLPDARRVLEDHPTDFVLMKNGTGGCRVAEADRAWKVIYKDEVATLFARTDSPLQRASALAKSTEPIAAYFP